MKTKIWLIIAIFLIIVGGAFFTGGMTMIDWDFSKLSTIKYETNEYKIDENFKNISVISKTADIEFIASDTAEVICFEQNNLKHSVNVKDNTLEIEVIDTRKVFDYIGINFKNSKITVHIPKGDYENLILKSNTGNVQIPGEFKFESIDVLQSTGTVTNRAGATGDIKIKTSTGDIFVESISANTVDLSVSTGKITVSKVDCADVFKAKLSTGKAELDSINCKSFITDGSTGGLSLKSVIATDKFDIERSTGNIKLEQCDAGEIYIKTDTGNVKGTLLSDKVFITRTDTGSVNVPETVTGGKCEIETDTGDIKIEIIK